MLYKQRGTSQPYNKKSTRYTVVVGNLANYIINSLVVFLDNKSLNLRNDHRKKCDPEVINLYVTRNLMLFEFVDNFHFFKLLASA